MKLGPESQVAILDTGSQTRSMRGSFLREAVEFNAPAAVLES
jgi:hypothetical protein